MRRHLVAGLLLLGFFAPSAAAQYRFDVWTADDGLPQNVITGIHQGRDGYLWIATLDGLARFDGVRFTVFTKRNSPGIQSNRFTCLFEDRHGDLWLGTEIGAVTRFSRGQFTTYTDLHGLSLGTVKTFTGDDAGNMWVLSSGAIRQWKPDAGRFAEVDVPRVHGGYREMEWEGRGAWGIDQSGLRRFVKGRWELRALPASRVANPLLAAEAQDGSLWLMGPADDLARLGPDGTFEVVRATTRSSGRDSSAQKPGAVNPDVHPGVQKPRGVIRNLAGVDMARQVTWRDSRGRSWTFQVGANLSRSLTLVTSGRSDTVSFDVLCEDRDGNLWLGTDGRGLYRVRKQVVTAYSEPQGLVGRNVYPVLQDREGAVWVGAWSGGLSRFQNGLFTTYGAKDGLFGGSVTALAEDREGRLWVASHGGIQTFRDGRFTALPPELQVDPVNVIHQDGAGAIWCGTNHGVWRYWNGAIVRFTTRDGLASDNVLVIIDSPAGGLWLGGTGGVTRLRDGTFTAFTVREGLPASMVRALYEDRTGVLWIGTYDSGLGRLHNGRITSYTTRDGLFNDGVFQILEDDRGSLWMSSNRGIHRVRKEELNELAAGRRRAVTSVAYGTADGMLNAECNGGLWPAGVKTRDGKLWFPTQDGVAVVDPASVVPNPTPPRVAIESFLLEREPLPPAALDRPIRLRPDQRYFEIQYTGLSFIDSEHLEFRYRLSGLDREWIEAGTRRTAYYSHIPPGRYTFSVIAANGDGVWNTDGASVTIVVLPPFYRTWWFLALIGAGAAGALMAAYEYRVARLKRAQAQQEAFTRQLIESQESERKRVAAELHDGLGQNLLVIKNRALLNAMQLSDGPSRTQFDEFSGALSHTLDEVRAIAHDLRPPHLDQLGLRTALAAMIEHVAANSTIRFAHELDQLDGRLPHAGEITLYRIVQECLNNILKHSGASAADVSVAVHDGELALTVHDNGRGFTTGGARHGRAGLGLQGIAERVRILGGTHSIRSAPGQGTTVRVTIAVGSQNG